jgi:hypothetical protein
MPTLLQWLLWRGLGCFSSRVFRCSSCQQSAHFATKEEFLVKSYDQWQKEEKRVVVSREKLANDLPCMYICTSGVQKLQLICWQRAHSPPTQSLSLVTCTRAWNLGGCNNLHWTIRCTKLPSKCTWLVRHGRGCWRVASAQFFDQEVCRSRGTIDTLIRPNIRLVLQAECWEKRMCAVDSSSHELQVHSLMLA